MAESRTIREVLNDVQVNIARHEERMEALCNSVDERLGHHVRVMEERQSAVVFRTGTLERLVEGAPGESNGLLHRVDRVEEHVRYIRRGHRKRAAILAAVILAMAGTVGERLVDWFTSRWHG